MCEVVFHSLLHIAVATAPCYLQDIRASALYAPLHQVSLHGLCAPTPWFTIVGVRRLAFVNLTRCLIRHVAAPKQAGKARPHWLPMRPARRSESEVWLHDLPDVQVAECAHCCACACLSPQVLGSGWDCGRQ